jgi:hypothetical protein
MENKPYIVSKDSDRGIEIEKALRNHSEGSMIAKRHSF